MHTLPYTHTAVCLEAVLNSEHVTCLPCLCLYPSRSLSGCSRAQSRPLGGRTGAAQGHCVVIGSLTPCSVEVCRVGVEHGQPELELLCVEAARSRLFDLIVAYNDQFRRKEKEGNIY